MVALLDMRGVVGYRVGVVGFQFGAGGLGLVGIGVGVLGFHVDVVGFGLGDVGVRLGDVGTRFEVGVRLGGIAAPLLDSEPVTSTYSSTSGAWPVSASAPSVTIGISPVSSATVTASLLPRRRRRRPPTGGAPIVPFFASNSATEIGRVPLWLSSGPVIVCCLWA